MTDNQFVNARSLAQTIPTASDSDVEQSNASAKTNSTNTSKSKYHIKRQEITLEAKRLAELLQETNVSSVVRLLEIFGTDFVGRMVAEALQLYSEAELKGVAAYEEPNTSVATSKSEPRTRGGVFFFLMRRHCINLGLDWSGLKISPPSWYEQKPRKLNSEPNTSATATKRETLQNGKPLQPNLEQKSHSSQFSAVSEDRVNKPENTPILNIKNSNAAKGISDITPPKVATDEANLVKPTRLKVTLVGTLTQKPKLNSQGIDGLLELHFKAEMSSSLPKGLPNLGSCKVVVWCTRKQLEKISQQSTITPQTRFLIEGEPSAAIGSDFTPFLKIICTRLTTIELEQGRTQRTVSNS